MDEQISTTVEATQEQTTPDVAQNQTTEDTEVKADVQPDAAQEPVESEAKTTETESQEQAEAKEEPPKDWEKIAKDNQASFTKVSMELAELKKQMQNAKPQIVENGRINPEYEQQYLLRVDNNEFLKYDNLARELEPETRAVVENLLNEARRLYNPKNKTAYEAKMAAIKDYFRSDIVEAIALEKQKETLSMQENFDKELQADNQRRAEKVVNAIEQVPELRELVKADSENFSPEVLNIIDTIFHFTGDVDIENTTKAIAKIKELGVKEHLAKQQAQSTKDKASVPEGNSVVQKPSSEISPEDASRNYQKYIDKFTKEGMSFNDAMAKLDAIIMKG